MERGQVGDGEQAGLGRAVIFDLDGVLTDTVEHHYRSWQRLADELGIPFDREKNEALRGRNRRDALRLFLGGADAGPEEELLARKNAFFHQSIEDLDESDLNPGVGRLLAQARERNVPLALASSSRNARLVCEKLGILGHFAAFADGCSGLRAKPAPDLFVWVAGRLGHPPALCTVVEDASAGVEAALAGGFRVIGLGPRERVAGAHLVLADLAGATLDELLGESAGGHSDSR